MVEVGERKTARKLHLLQLGGNVVGHVQVIGVELMQSDEAVFGAAREGLAEGVHIQGVDGAKVTLHTSKLLAINYVEEPSFKLASRGRSHRHGLGILSAPQQHVRVRGGQHCAIDRPLGLECLHRLQGVGV